MTGDGFSVDDTGCGGGSDPNRPLRAVPGPVVHGHRHLRADRAGPGPGRTERDQRREGVASRDPHRHRHAAAAAGQPRDRPHVGRRRRPRPAGRRRHRRHLDGVRQRPLRRLRHHRPDRRPPDPRVHQHLRARSAHQHHPADHLRREHRHARGRRRPMATRRTATASTRRSRPTGGWWRSGPTPPTSSRPAGTRCPARRVGPSSSATATRTATGCSTSRKSVKRPDAPDFRCIARRTRRTDVPATRSRGCRRTASISRTSTARRHRRLPVLRHRHIVVVRLLARPG